MHYVTVTLNDLSRTAVESKSNRSCNHRVAKTTISRAHTARYLNINLQGEQQKFSPSVDLIPYLQYYYPYHLQKLNTYKFLALKTMPSKNLPKSVPNFLRYPADRQTVENKITCPDIAYSYV